LSILLKLGVVISDSRYDIIALISHLQSLKAMSPTYDVNS